MEVREINFLEIDRCLYERKNIIYGAGYNGKLLFELLKDKNVSVEAFYDDDICRQGKEYCGRTILSLDFLQEYSASDINIVISSMYVGQILSKLNKLRFGGRVYTVIERLLEKDSREFQFEKYKDHKEIMMRLDALIQCSNDEMTKKYSSVIKKTIEHGKAVTDIVDLYQGEKQYFLKEFRGRLDGIIFLDAGAYTGDTVRELLDEKVAVEKIYCFEADSNNFLALQKFCQENLNDDQYCCVNAAL